MCRFWWLLSFLAASVLLLAPARSDEKPVNINDLESDLTVPSVTDDKPAAGTRVRQVNPGYEAWKLFHVLYLPTDWKSDGKYPVIVEFPGNGGYQNKYGDKCSGRVEDCKLGYGISGGRKFIWVCLPFVDPKGMSHSITWWGDADATATYCRETVTRICQNFGGDPEAVVLTGFSRGAEAEAIRWACGAQAEIARVRSARTGTNRRGIRISVKTISALGKRRACASTSSA